MTPRQAIRFNLLFGAPSTLEECVDWLCGTHPWVFPESAELLLLVAR
jgi:hypothetical protein